MRNRSMRRKGQVTVESAMVYGMVSFAVIGTGIYVQRAVSGGIRNNADSLGTQFSIDQDWESHSKSLSQETVAESASAQTSKSCQDLNQTPMACTAADPKLPGSGGNEPPPEPPPSP
jgi:hypothetical protein